MTGSTDLELPRAVLFDWDNTLVDTWATIAECYRATFAAFGLSPWTEEEVRRRAHGECRRGRGVRARGGGDTVGWDWESNRMLVKSRGGGGDDAADRRACRGPRRRSCRDLLEPSDRRPTAQRRVRAPVGIALGGRTPAEIAISVVAELLADRHGGSGAPMNVVPQALARLGGAAGSAAPGRERDARDDR